MRACKDVRAVDSARRRAERDEPFRGETNARACARRLAMVKKNPRQSRGESRKDEKCVSSIAHLCDDEFLRSRDARRSRPLTRPTFRGKTYGYSDDPHTTNRDPR